MKTQTFKFSTESDDGRVNSNFMKKLLLNCFYPGSVIE